MKIQMFLFFIFVSSACHQKTQKSTSAPANLPVVNLPIENVLPITETPPIENADKKKPVTLTGLWQMDLTFEKRKAFHFDFQKVHALPLLTDCQRENPTGDLISHFLEFNDSSEVKRYQVYYETDTYCLAKVASYGLDWDEQKIYLTSDKRQEQFSYSLSAEHLKLWNEFTGRWLIINIEEGVLMENDQRSFQLLTQRHSYQLTSLKHCSDLSLDPGDIVSITDFYEFYIDGTYRLILASKYANLENPCIEFVPEDFLSYELDREAQIIYFDWFNYRPIRLYYENVPEGKYIYFLKKHKKMPPHKRRIIKL